MFENDKAPLSEAQEEYFKDSVIRDNKGDLLTCYHGTNHSFNEFKFIDKQPGYWFTEDPEYASFHGHNVLEVYLNIKKPFDFDDFEAIDWMQEKFFKDNSWDESEIYTKKFRNFLQKEGFDGMIFTHSGAKTIIALEPNQIKAVDNIFPTKENNFRDNGDDYFSLGEDLYPSLEDKLISAENRALAQNSSDKVEKSKDEPSI